MIVYEKLLRPYEETTIRTMVVFKCDYCEKEFLRGKKTRERLNKNISKDSCGSAECRKLKQIDINMKLYGVPSRFESDEFKKQNEKTCMERYGTKQYYSSIDFQKKRKTKLIQNFGVDSPLKNEEIKNKQLKTKQIIASNDPNYFKNSVMKAKMTCIKKYGVESAMQLPENRQKVSERFAGKNHHNWVDDRENKKQNDYWRHKVRVLLRNTLKYLKTEKSGLTVEILGYSADDLMNHIQKHNNWSNCKDGIWHIDHIFPVQAFIDYNIINPTLVNSLDNLQPLLAEENLSKHDNYCSQEFESWLKSKGIPFTSKTSSEQK